VIIADIPTWTDTIGKQFLCNLGVAEGDYVADIGCRSGRYTISAAQAVGRSGRVYAFDREDEAINELDRDLQACGLANVRMMHVDLLDKVLPDAVPTLDKALLFDVLHARFFPETQQRLNLLRWVNDLLHPDGLMIVYPTYADEYGPPLEQLESEIRQAGFMPIGCNRHILIHDQVLLRDWLYLYQPRRGSGGGRV